MNKYLKKIMAFALSVGIVVGMEFGFVGCGGNEKDNVPDTPIVDPSYDPNKDKEPDKDPDNNKDPDKEPDNPDKPPVPEKVTLEDAKAEFDAFLQRVTTGKNFTYVLKNPLQNITAEFAGDKVKLDRNGEVTFLTEENGENFVYGLEEDKAWHKDFADEKVSIDYALSSVTDALDDITWTAYDEGANLLSGKVSVTVEGLPTNAEIQANFDQNDMNVKIKNGLTTTDMSLTKVGTTAVALPENVIDETAKKNNIFTVENGEYVWNVKAIKEVLEPWLKNEMTDANGNHVDNQFGEDVFAYMRMNPDYKSKEVVYVNVTDKLTFGMIFDVADQIKFGEIYLNGSTFKDKISNGEIITKKDFEQYLRTVPANTIKNSVIDFDVEYTTHDEDYETSHKQEFETLTKNVWQNYTNSKVENMANIIVPDEIENYIVLFGMKTKAGEPVLGDHVYSRQWSQYYILQNKKSEEIIFSKILVGSHTNELGYLENVLQNKNGTWYTGTFEKITNIANENKVFFNSYIETNKIKE